MGSFKFITSVLIMNFMLTQHISIKKTFKHFIQSNCTFIMWKAMTVFIIVYHTNYIYFPRRRWFIERKVIEIPFIRYSNHLKIPYDEYLLTNIIYWLKKNEIIFHISMDFLWIVAERRNRFHNFNDDWSLIYLIWKKI